jgi:hypothetical protein
MHKAPPAAKMRTVMRVTGAQMSIQSCYSGYIHNPVQIR